MAGALSLEEERERGGGGTGGGGELLFAVTRHLKLN